MCLLWLLLLLSLLLLPMSLSSVASAEQIRNRAAEVRQNSEYTGIFELIVYADLRCRRALLCFGEEIVDLCAFLAPVIASRVASKGHSAPGPARFAGVLYQGSGKLVSANREGVFAPVVNH